MTPEDFYAGMAGGAPAPRDDNRAALIAALISGGAGIGQSVMAAKANSSQGMASRQLQRGQLLAGASSDELDDLFRRQQSALASTQLDPVAGQRHLFTAGVMGDLAGHGPIRVGTSGVQNPFTPSQQTQGFMGQDALAGAAGRFYENVGRIDPTASIPSLSGMGFGASGADHQHEMESGILDAAQRYEELNRLRRQDLMNSIAEDKKDDGDGGGSPWWKKVLAGGALAGAAFIPGLQAAAPWAASALLGSGVGTAMGGVQGGIAGAAGSAVKSGQDYFNRRMG